MYRRRFAEWRIAAHPGDRLVVPGRRPGAAHVADVLEVLGRAGRPPYRVRWQETGRESVAFPGPDAYVERRTRGDERRAAAPGSRPYEIWQLLRRRAGKRAVRLLGAVSTAAEANRLARSIARVARQPRATLVVQDARRRIFLRRGRPPG